MPLFLDCVYFADSIAVNEIISSLTSLISFQVIELLSIPDLLFQRAIPLT